MNVLFGLIFLVCTFLLLCTSPDGFLSAMLDGAGKAATLCVSLVATYAVWMGLMKVWEDSGVARGVSRLLKPAAKKLLKSDDEEALSAVCMNLSVNMLGISGAATPYGIKACKLLDQSPDAEYSSSMFFVLNATSIQLLPTSIIGVRVAMQSVAPYDVVLPILLTSLFSTVLAVALARLFIPPKKTRKNSKIRLQTKGAGAY
jgi:spore maturation protein A